MENYEDTTTTPRKKKRFKVILWSCVLTAGLAGGTIAYKTEVFPSFNGAINQGIEFLQGLNQFKGDTSKEYDAETVEKAIANLPLDENGIVSITYPGVNRNLNEPAGFYSLPDSYTAFCVENGSLIEANLQPISNSSKNGVNVINYQCQNGNPPDNFIGVQNSYAEFVKRIIEIKEKIAKKDKSITSELKHFEYEVPDLYLVKTGYELYCENQSLMAEVKLAGVVSEGKIYSIPSRIAHNFIGITKETSDLIAKFNEFQGQIATIYNIYFANGVPYDDEQTDRSR